VALLETVDDERRAAIPVRTRARIGECHYRQADPASLPDRRRRSPLAPDRHEKDH